MRVLMLPTLESQKNSLNSGVNQVLLHYHKYAKKYGIEFVGQDQGYDITAVHAGASPVRADVAILHGLYWTADYPASRNEFRTNARIVESIRTAKEITVPSAWVAESIQRDVRVSPHIVPHGIDIDDWTPQSPQGKYILWNKNRDKKDVCDSSIVVDLAERFPRHLFLSTFANNPPPNVKVTGRLPFGEMKPLVQGAGVYLSTTKETFGVGVLEAMASQVPVLGWAQGGNLDLIQHGVNGYLARPGDFDDLVGGLHLCLKNQQEWGAAGRELAALWTWDSAVEKLAKVFGKANRSETHTVGVIIPVYNKDPKDIQRAIYSVIDQTLPPDRLVIVDDGSTNPDTKKYLDQLERDLTGYTGINPQVIVMRQKNQGVANARNNGIARAGNDLICCLDADDWLEKDYLRICVTALRNNPGLGIAYTGMMTHEPDGTQKVGRWPGQADASKQMNRRNQVPTCCVFRYKAWERLGGYRQRYAPDGAGYEDGEFWLRQMAYGFRAEEITPEPLFNYSWLSGWSGRKDKKRIDWTQWHPFTKDQQHPFMSVVPPANNLSHPVRQYDEPVISVIIPVGPGHEKYLVDALDSLEAQTYRKWEAIVIDDTPKKKLKERYCKAYSYVKWHQTERGNQGPGKARNIGAAGARAPFLLFLDADDYLEPDCMSEMLRAWNDTQGIIYTDYTKIITGVERTTVEKEKKVRKIRNYDPKKKVAIAEFAAYDFDCERAIKQPELGKVPYLWCLVTCLVPTAWHQAIGGYDEKMSSWEDGDYAWRMVKAGHCYTRIAQPLVTVRSYTGNRVNIGLQQHENLIKYIIQKGDGENMGCSGCGGNRRVSVPQNVEQVNAQTATTQQVDDFVLIEYLRDPMGRINSASHPVYGKTVDPRTNQKRFYGSRKCGDIFYMHKDDVFMETRQGTQVDSRYKLVRENRAVETVVKPPPRPEPKSQTLLSGDIAALKERIMAQTQERFAPPEQAEIDLTQLPGVTPEIVAQLEEKGVKTTQDIYQLGIAGLVTVKGIGQTKAQTILEWAQEQGAQTE